MRKSTLNLATLLLAALSWPGCAGSGGGSPHAPSAVATPPPNALAAGTSVSMVSGENQKPVAGARVILAGREYTSDAAGQVTLAEAVSFGSLVDVVVAGFLSRQTTLRSSGGTPFVLWPRATTSGLDEDFTAQIVYTWATSDPPAHGTTPLERPREGTTQAVVSLSQQILDDGAAHQAHAQAVDDLNAWLGSRMRYVLAGTPPASGVVFVARVDPADAECADGTRAYFLGDYNPRGEITGGEVVYCSLDVARSATVSHELGHSVGLQHSYGRSELMTPFFSRSRNTGFSAREGLVMNLLFERRAGNMFPDSDRAVSGAAMRSRKIVCG